MSVMKNYFFDVIEEYMEMREKAGVPVEKYPFWLDEEGIERLDNKDKVRVRRVIEGKTYEIETSPKNN